MRDLFTSSGLGKGLQSRADFFAETFARGATAVYAWGGALSLALGATLIGIFDMPASWAVATVLAVLAAIVFEGGYRAVDRLRVALADREERASSLPDVLDDLMREGMAIDEEFAESTPITPTDDGGYHVPLFPDSGQVSRAAAFEERARGLLRDRRPSLLPIYADAVNESQRRAREREEARKSEQEPSEPTSLKAVALSIHRQPAVYLRAVLDGLAAARNHLGH